MMEAWAAEIAGTAVAVAPVASAGLGAKVGGWAAGIAASLALPFVFAWLAGKGLDALMSWQLSRVLGILKDGGGDPAWEEFEKDQVLAVVKLAQAKFPGAGLGPEREKAVLDFLTAKVPILKGQEERLKALIKTACEKEAVLLAEIKARALAAQNPQGGQP